MQAKMYGRYKVHTLIHILFKGIIVITIITTIWVLFPVPMSLKAVSSLQILAKVISKTSLNTRIN